MARAKTKEELVFQSEQGFSKLWSFIDSMPESSLNTEFDFSDDPSKKEQHWHRDRNLRDVLIHLYEWHQLLIKWIDSNVAGDAVNFLPEPYTWKTYGEMNVEFWRKHQATDLLQAQKWLRESHCAALAIVENFTNEELFNKQSFNWTGTTTLGSYCISAMPSHYDWALKKIRAHVKKTS
ncbi:ClbS/DfsB family four-helix bundle protein [Vibrio ziniensis]|uniref:ClbS/DfsB family four-helix bundle protein n=1 Tax=Vibrio ziniensis TaxID=2711221 RepID=A0A6G7CFE5_9VIBR|nr:ClbS/DfsB family four-helix bundle protein [Vibrio ziniensis]QIH40814.1 ClbS/DfsB family four-helix bundle protein [Vibrio ziniensis]